MSYKHCYLSFIVLLFLLFSYFLWIRYSEEKLHSLLATWLCCWVMGNLKLMQGHLGHRVDMLPVCHQAQSHTKHIQNLQSAYNMSLDWGRNAKHPNKTLEAQEKQANIWHRQESTHQPWMSETSVRTAKPPCPLLNKLKDLIEVV